MKKKLWLVIDFKTSWHQQKAGAPCGSVISFFKTEEEVKEYVKKADANGGSNAAIPLDTPQEREIACGYSIVCARWVKDNKDFLDRYDENPSQFRE